MFNRQATSLLVIFILFFGLSACSTSETPNFPTLAPPTPTATFTPAPPTAIPPTPTATPLACLSAPGELVDGEISTQERPIAFIVYLPPCYDQFPDQRYPVLYLLHGQTYIDDQWVRLGAPKVADELIHSGKSVPFIMVFPEDRYWNIIQGLHFGAYMLTNVIPYMDGHFRTIPDKEHRAIGGLSRGGGWAFQLALTHPELFSSLGLHAPAILSGDRAIFVRWLQAIPPDQMPRIYFDVGDNDLERDFNIQVEAVLTGYGIPHEWHLNTGAHNEAYWSAHVEEYIQWYAAGWK